MTDPLNDLDYDRDIASQKNDFGFSGLTNRQAAYANAVSERLLDPQRKRMFALNNQFEKSRAADLAFARGQLEIDQRKKELQRTQESNLRMEEVMGQFNSVADDDALTPEQRQAEFGRIQMDNAQTLSGSTFGSAYMQGLNNFLLPQLKRQAEDRAYQLGIEKELQREQRAVERKEEDTSAADYLLAQMATDPKQAELILDKENPSARDLAMADAARVVAQRNQQKLELDEAKRKAALDKALLDQQRKDNLTMADDAIDSFDKALSSIIKIASDADIDTGQVELSSAEQAIIDSYRGTDLRYGSGAEDVISISPEAGPDELINKLRQAQNKASEIKRSLLTSPTPSINRGGLRSPLSPTIGSGFRK